MDYVVGSKTSREEWMKLNDRYATNSRSHVMQLKTDLYTITKGMDSIEKYLMKVIRARNQLLALGVRMEDEDIVVVVLNGLPAEFNLIKAIIRGRKSPIAMQELRILLLSAERDIANRVVLNIQAFSAMKTKKIVSQRCLNDNGNMSKTGGDVRRNRNNFLSSSQCQICREKDTAVRCSYRNIALPDQFSNFVLICQICDMKGHAALECNHLGTHIGVTPVVVDGGEQTVVIDEREHNMINDDGSDNSGSVVVTDEREHNMINGDGSDKSGRENICGIFVAEDNSSTGSDESDSSRTENIGGVCSIAEDFSSTGSSIGIQYVDQVPHDIASFEAVIRNSVCLVVGGLKVEVHAIHQDQVMMISTAFLITLCVVHNFGTSKVGIAIDPAFFIWFCPLGGIGIYNIVQNDSSVLRAFNHVHIYSFFKRNSTKALHSLESCLLCATSSEAMYTDLCYFVVQFVQLTFVCLVLSSLMWGYLGHTAYLMENPSGADQHLFLQYQVVLSSLCSSLLMLLH